MGCVSSRDKTTGDSTDGKPYGRPIVAIEAELTAKTAPDTTKAKCEVIDIIDIKAEERVPESKASDNGVSTKETDQIQINFSKLAEEALEKHNEYRKRHNAEPLTLSQDLSSTATKWAQQLAESGKLEHSSSGCGENHAYRASQHHRDFDDIGIFSTNMWYDEVKNYDYNYQGFSTGTGHFTQVVWKGSKELGIGVGTKYDKAKGMYTCIVCANYRPAGNIQGAFEENVEKP